jgi:hypothetical protein
LNHHRQRHPPDKLDSGFRRNGYGCFGKVMPLTHAQAMSLDITMLLMATTLVVGVIRKPH